MLVSCEGVMAYAEQHTFKNIRSFCVSLSWCTATATGIEGAVCMHAIPHAILLVGCMLYTTLHSRAAQGHQWQQQLWL
jgi:hypothetical protein